MYILALWWVFLYCVFSSKQLLLWIQPSFQENTFENFVYKRVSILVRPQYVIFHIIIPRLRHICPPRPRSHPSNPRQSLVNRPWTSLPQMNTWPPWRNKSNMLRKSGTDYAMKPVFEIARWTEARDWQKQRRSSKATVFAGLKVHQSILVFGNSHFGFKVPNCLMNWIFIVPMCSI